MRKRLIATGAALAASLAFTGVAGAEPHDADTGAPATRIIFGSDAGMFTMRPDGTNVKAIGAPFGDLSKHPDWSPDGRRFVATIDTPSGEIWVANAEGSDAHLVRGCGDGCGYIDEASFSPDGRSIAFSQIDPLATDDWSTITDSIRVLDLSTGAERVVRRSKPGQLIDIPRWSPDGDRLVVEVDRFNAAGDETGAKVATLAVDSGRMRSLTPFSTYSGYADWSPRGDSIVFDTYDIGFPTVPGTASNLFTIRPDGSHLRQLTDLPVGGNRASEPTFTPDGKRIIFLYQTPRLPDRSGRHAAFIDANGGPIQVVSTPDFTTAVTHPRLQPTGER